ncbi:MAG: hypothetical protein AAFO06_01175 [Cyanobacteria bacterium J06597_16]
MMPANPTASFPLWQYLCQPIGQPDRKLIVNPVKFWHLKKVNFIERCWVISYTPEKHTH